MGTFYTKVDNIIMNVKTLIRFLEEYSEDTEVLVREGYDHCSDFHLVSLQDKEDDEKITVYLTSVERMIRDKSGQEKDYGFLKSYPRDLHKVCAHGRSVYGTCGVCNEVEEYLISENS